MKDHQRPIGLTRDVGFQIGARRIINLPPEVAWELVTSIKGINLWLGPVSTFDFEKGKTYKLDDGSFGEVLILSPGSHLRLTYQPTG